HARPRQWPQRTQTDYQLARHQQVKTAARRLQAAAPALQPGQARLPGGRAKRRTIAPEAAFLQREPEQAEPVCQAAGGNAAGLAEAITGKIVTPPPGAPGIDAGDQQVAARPDAARRFAQQTMGRQT